MRPADALRAASIIMSNSIMLSLTGAAMGCTRKTSRSLMFSCILTNVLSFLNLNTSQLASDMPRYEQMSLASWG